jgi:response regulator RpfG family c-di-GMP phosphodiesterase
VDVAHFPGLEDQRRSRSTACRHLQVVQMDIIAELDRRRVLIVDDDQAVRELLAEGLTSFGYPTLVANSAREAFDTIQQEPVRLVLSDIDMPGGNGIELLKRIKAYDADLDVIMVTGAIDADTAVRAIRQGASDYVTKPFNLDEVQIVVERTLEKRHLILQNRAYQERLEEIVALRTRELLDKKREVERLYEELQISYESSLHALVTALDLRDNETHGHSYRVVEYAVVVAETLGVTEPELTWIRRGAILHDVGKIGIPDAILRKPDKLNAEEWLEMKRHPEMGFRMLEHIRFLQPALDVVLSHQERWDGTGYPRQLRDEQIPLGARIFAVVDTFDAMTSDRPYRAALSIQTARAEIERCAGTQFDPQVAEAFLSIPDATWHEIRERVHRNVMGLEEQVKRVLAGSAHSAVI